MPNSLQPQFLESEENYRKLSLGQIFSLAITALDGVGLGLVFESIAKTLTLASIMTLSLTTAAFILGSITIIPTILLGSYICWKKYHALKKENAAIINRIQEIEAAEQESLKILNQIRRFSLAKLISPPPEAWTTENLEQIRDGLDDLYQQIVDEVERSFDFCKRCGIGVKNEAKIAQYLKDPNRNFKTIFPPAKQPLQASNPHKERAKSFLVGLCMGFGIVAGILGLTAVFFPVITPFIIGIAALSFAFILGGLNIIARITEEKREKARAYLEQKNEQLNMQNRNLEALRAKLIRIESAYAAGHSAVKTAVKHGISPDTLPFFSGEMAKQQQLNHSMQQSMQISSAKPNIRSQNTEIESLASVKRNLFMQPKTNHHPGFPRWQTTLLRKQSQLAQVPQPASIEPEVSSSPNLSLA